MTAGNKQVLWYCLVAIMYCLGGSAYALQAKPPELIVAVNGSPTGAGSLTDPLTLEAAIQQLAEQLTDSGLPNGGMSISVLAGRYYFSKPLLLGPQFQGTEESPIVIRAQPDAGVVFDGSFQLDPLSFCPVTADNDRARLAAGTADQILVATVTDPEVLDRLNQNVMLNLSFNGENCLPSVFPNDGYAKFKPEMAVPEISPPGLPSGKENYGVRAGHPPYQEAGKAQGWKGSLAEPRGAWAGFADKGDQMAGSWLQWEHELARNNARNQLTGFIEANWLLSSQAIVAASAELECIQLSRALAYGWAWRQGDKPFRVFGLLCELDSPGEWHFDPLTNQLFIYPPTQIEPDTLISLAVAPGFITLKDTSHVQLIGLDVQNVGSGSVYRIEGGHDNLIASSTISNCTARGLEISGLRNGAAGCDLFDLSSHVSLRGGVRSPSEITPADNFVENCHIYQHSSSHQKVGISMRGVGNLFSHNLVHNSIGQAMVVNGNDHLIELNEFFNIGYEEGDGGAVYSGADLAGYGNTYRYNFFHHLMHVPGKVARSGIHLDDHQAGSICIGNVFYKSAEKGIFYNGGAGHVARDNVFLEGSMGIYNVGAGASKSYQRQKAIFSEPDHMYQNTKENYVGRAEQTVGEKGWEQAPWRERYPLFHEVMSDEGEFGRLWPIHCLIDGNYYFGNTRFNHTEFSRVDAEALAKSSISNDRLASPDYFVDYEHLDFTFKDEIEGLPSIPFADIGLQLDRFRSEMPDKTHYRFAIKEYFFGIGSMPGTHMQFDSASIVEEGPAISGGPSEPRT